MGGSESSAKSFCAFLTVPAGYRFDAGVAIAYFANGMTARCVIRYVFNKDMEKDEVFVTFGEW